jgi:hypothetical protein
MHQQDEKCMQNFGVKGIDHLKDVDTDGRILKLILKEQV